MDKIDIFLWVALYISSVALSYCKGRIDQIQYQIDLIKKCN